MQESRCRVCRQPAAESRGINDLPDLAGDGADEEYGEIAARLDPLHGFTRAARYGTVERTGVYLPCLSVASSASNRQERVATGGL